MNNCTLSAGVFFRASSFIGFHFVGTNNIFFSVSNIVTNNVSVLRNGAVKITWNFHGVGCITRHNSKFNCVLRGGRGWVKFLEVPISWRRKINRCKPSQIFSSKRQLKVSLGNQTPFSGR